MLSDSKDKCESKDRTYQDRIAVLAMSRRRAAGQEGPAYQLRYDLEATQEELVILPSACGLPSERLQA